MASCAAAVAGLAAPGDVLDLSGWLVVTPGGRAERALRLRLLEDHGRGRAIVPPRTVTPGGLVTALLPMRGVVAGPLVRWWAWAEGVRSLAEAQRRVLIPSPPAPDDSGAWLRIGAMLDAALVELGAEGLTFRTAAARASEVARHADADRWGVLPEVEAHAERLLAGAGFVHADLVRAGARLESSVPLPEAGVVLACVAELSGVARRALRLAAERVRVVALVPAPEEDGARFDEFGCPTREWARGTLDVPGACMRIVDDATDQADAALEAVLEAGARGAKPQAGSQEPETAAVPSSPGWAADEVLFVAPDAAVVPRLERRALLAGIRVRDAAGEPLARSRPAMLLEAAAEFLETRRYRAMGSLARHADVEPWLSERIGASGQWLAALDEYARQHLPLRVDGEWLRATDRGSARSVDPGPEGPARSRESGERVERVASGVEALLGELASSERRASGEWARAIVDMLARVYGSRPLNPDAPADAALAESLTRMRDRAAEMRDLPATWGGLTGAQALRCVLMLCEGETIPPAQDPDAVEVVGWLEAPLDDAPVVVVTGVNEGLLPQKPAPSAILSEAVRAAVGTSDRERRLARDSFLLTLLRKSRPHVTLIAGRRGGDGEPRLPSRLLMRCERGALAERVLLWSPPENAVPRPIRRPPPAGSGPGVRSAFTPFASAGERPARSALRVTDFGAYLRSPYLYYLERELKLRETPEEAGELDRLAFGELLHEVLKAFADGPEAKSADAGRIAAFVESELERRVRALHGATPPAAVVIQAAQARERLLGFARWQAERAAAGWRIAESEWAPPEAPAFDVDGEAVTLIGRIDRIDRHPEHGWALLDYKSGDTAQSPVKKHRRGGRWIDLQLPLYRVLARVLTGGAEPQLGYVLLPASASGPELAIAAWDEDALREAEEAAREVVRRIRRGEFFEEGDFPPESGTFAALCGTLHLPAEGEGEQEGGGDA